jgi:death-on-curing protein
MKYLTARDVLRIHDVVINANELQGLAGDKSLEAVMGRVETRVRYGLIRDEFELAATYAVMLVVGRPFSCGNKRTAYATMRVCLSQNGIEPGYDVIEAADMIIQAAQRKVDEKELALWLRRRAR